MTQNYWEKLSRQELLQLPIQDLGLCFRGSSLELALKQLHQELGQKGLKLKPHAWISDEWFCPDGITGIAVPFYLFHPKLARLERDMMGFVEGASHRQKMMLLRHETGHAIDNAFGLRRIKRRQRMFGLSGQEYPDHYQPDSTSREFVHHLPDFYAQAHPEEDWAETFAVWLDPKSNWKDKYQSWGALEKLELVDDLMLEVKGLSPRVKQKNETVDSIEDNLMTLAEYYDKKQRHFRVGRYGFFNRYFPPRSSRSDHYQKLHVFLNTHRELIQSKLQADLGVEKAQCHRLLEVMALESKTSDYRVSFSKNVARRELISIFENSLRSFSRSAHAKIPM